ncbi:MAG TPA: hypothetical protein ENI43_03060 [Firmicutes bacterium]|nr:hypothetical protein [Bacillota bacterium]
MSRKEKIIFIISLTAFAVIYLNIFSPLDKTLDELIYNLYAYEGNISEMPQLAHHLLFHTMQYLLTFITTPVGIMPLDGIRFIHIGIYVGLLYLIFSITYSLTGNKKLAILSTIIFGTSFTTLYQAMSAEPIFLSLFFLTFGYYLIKPDEEPRLVSYGTCGLVFALAVLIHQIVIPCIIGVVIYSVIMAFKYRSYLKPTLVMVSIFITTTILTYAITAKLLLGIQNLKDIYLWLTYYGHKQWGLGFPKNIIFTPIAFIRVLYRGQAIADWLNFSANDWRLPLTTIALALVSIFVGYLIILFLKNIKKLLSNMNWIYTIFIGMPLLLILISVVIFMSQNYEYYIIIIAHLAILLPLTFFNKNSTHIKKILIAFIIILFLSNTILEFLPQSILYPISAPLYHLNASFKNIKLSKYDTVISTLGDKLGLFILYRLRKNYNTTQINWTIIVDKNSNKLNIQKLEEIENHIENVKASGKNVYLTGEVINPPEPKFRLFRHTTYPFGYEIGKRWKDRLKDTGEKFLFKGRYYKIYEFTR